MEIKILEFVEGARKAKGVTVIIDVFRAFSVECYAFDSGAARIIATATPEEAFVLKKKYLNSVLAGERNEKKIEGFDFGNSPTEILKADLHGKTVIHTTTAGTQGLISAKHADLILAAGLVNASAVAGYIKLINPQDVTLVAMGYRAAISADEDLLCAELIASCLVNKSNFDFARISDLKNTSGRRFFDPLNLDFSPPTDYFLCTMTDRFNFALKGIVRTDGNVDIVRIDI
jgi:2-phosphosulfolactate phosphatase